MEKRLKNVLFCNPNGKQSVYDITIPTDWNKKLIIFLHGYMGFKDWGAWNLVEDFFVDQHFGFLKFNFSHNGGTIEQPTDFPDLDSFGKNTYSKELDDLTAILDEVEQLHLGELDIYLIGHSRGGGIAALQGMNPRISKIALLAPISSIEDRFPTGEALKKWQDDGVYYRLNGRTHQQMPHSFEQYEDFRQNKDRLEIQKICQETTIPYLVIHGAEDTSVPPENGEKIADWSKGEFILLPATAHTFGASQPWQQKTLPLKLELACKQILPFFNSTK